MPYLETIVCQTSKGKEARFERMIKSRVEYSKRQDGCENAWYGISSTDEYLFIIQICYDSMDSFHNVKKLVEETLDKQDGGLEACLSGPPLLGLFEINANAISATE